MTSDNAHRRNQANRIVVIGAGAAGLVAATEAARRGRDRGGEVVLLEKNGKTGVKILMSGGTRCNITQDTDAKGIVHAFGRGGRFLQKSVGAFGPADVVKMFNDAGVATKVESTGKVFPESNRAVHVRNALLDMAEDAGVRILCRCPVQSFDRTPEGGWMVQTPTESFSCDQLIVTAGGKSWPGCGTTGDAYAWLQRLGHTIVRTRPALVPLVGGYNWTHALSGLTLDDCTANVYREQDWQTKRPSKRKPVTSRRSSWLFTHHGFSGPAAMDVSGDLTEADRFDDVRLVVDLLPELNHNQMISALSDRSGSGRRTVASIVSDWLPARLAEAITRASDADTTIAQLSRRQLENVTDNLKSIHFPVQGTRGFAKAEVTAGGVTLSEVDPATMASRLVPGLFIAGEVLDVDGWIGGYNFQAAFSTGRAAGIAAANADL